MSNIKTNLSFFQHIKILRKHIIRILLGIIICTIILMYNKKILFDIIIFGPSKSNFIIYKILNKYQYFKEKYNFLLENNNLLIQNRYIFGQFNTYIWISFLGGLILSSPYIFFEIWSFIKPALHKKEIKYFNILFIISLLLFIIGILFGYFIVFPIIIQFSYDFKISNIPKNIFDLSDYISIFMQVIFSIGIAFLIPIILLLLNKIDIINVKILQKYRKHAILILLIISAAITPSDILSTIIITCPLIILYELSILFIKLKNKFLKI